MTGVDLYRTRDFVADFDAISAEYSERSRKLSADARVREVAYGRRAREKLDLIFPQSSVVDAPLHVFVHGGYWRHGDKADYRFVAEPAISVGAVVGIVEYDLMPGQRLPLLVNQVRRAVNWLQAHAREFGADPARITVSGHSAGAHLSSYLAAIGPNETVRPSLPSLKGLLLLSGIYDLSAIPDSFLKHEAKMTYEEAADWSPLASAQLACPNRIIAFGRDETEPFHTQASAFHAKLGAAGHASELTPMPQLNHMSGLLNLGSINSALGQRLAEMIEAT